MNASALKGLRFYFLGPALLVLAALYRLSPGSDCPLLPGLGANT
jgi:hypothetical protein